MDKSKCIWCRGKRYRVERWLKIGRRDYAIVRRLSGQRERYMAFDPKAGPDGDLRGIHVFKKSPFVRRQLRLMQDISTNNSNVPSIFEYHEWKGKIYVVLTWSFGTPLDEYLTDVRAGKLPHPAPAQVIRLIRGLAHGVSHFNYRKNVAHGDIKPANLILTDATSRLVLIDFGSAWHVERSNEWMGNEGITPAYSAPELQVEADARGHLGTPGFLSDQFSISVVFYEFLTLQLPYEGMGGAAGASCDLRQAMAGALVPAGKLTKYKGDLPAAVWKDVHHVLNRGLQLMPSDRFPDRGEWLGRLDGIDSELKRIHHLKPWQRSLLDLLELPSKLMRSGSRPE